jgi:hypothetical protein
VVPESEGRVRLEDGAGRPFTGFVGVAGFASSDSYAESGVRMAGGAGRTSRVSSAAGAGRRSE